MLLWQIHLLFAAQDLWACLGSRRHKYGARALKLPKQPCRLRPCLLPPTPALCVLSKVGQLLGQDVLASGEGAGKTYQLDQCWDSSGLTSGVFKYTSPWKDWYGWGLGWAEPWEGELACRGYAQINTLGPGVQRLLETQRVSQFHLLQSWVYPCVHNLPRCFRPSRQTKIDLNLSSFSGSFPPILDMRGMTGQNLLPWKLAIIKLSPLILSPNSPSNLLIMTWLPDGFSIEKEYWLKAANARSPKSFIFSLPMNTWKVGETYFHLQWNPVLSEMEPPSVLTKLHFQDCQAENQIRGQGDFPK